MAVPPQMARVARASRGALLVETCFLFLYIFGVVFWFHIETIRHFDDRARKLQGDRIPYDGVQLWKPLKSGYER